MTRHISQKLTTLLIAIVQTVSLASNVAAAGSTAEVSWNPNTDSDLAGYRVHVGTSSGQYGPPIDVGNPPNTGGREKYSLTGLDPKTTYFVAVTAYDTTNNESDPSAEAVRPGERSQPPLPLPPAGQETTINFQPSGNAPAGFTGDLDFGNIYTSSRGYGWDRKIKTRIRGRATNLNSTFAMISRGQPTATWEHDVANGEYLITVTSGDSRKQNRRLIKVEGQTIINSRQTQNNQFETVVDSPVTVNDGKLTVELTNPAGSHAVVNWLSFKPR